MYIKEKLKEALKYHQADKLDKALPIYKDIIKDMPNHQFVLTLLTNIAQNHFQLAQSLMQTGRLKAAIISFEHVLSIRNDIPDVYFLLGQLNIRIGEKSHASKYLRDYLKFDPFDKAGAIMLLSHLGEAKMPEKPSQTYLKNFYDNYAATYDDHLINRLNYSCPKVILHALNNNIVVDADILDLGCGTGLCGEAIKHLCNRLDGVDLSQPMVNIASKKNIYNELEIADVCEFMEKKRLFYDVIVAAGLFEHIGVPEQVFKAVFNTLKDNGYFIFTTDENENDDVGINSAGFYMHGKNYLEKQALKCGFELISMENVSMWIENKKTVTGLVVTLFKPALVATS